MGIYLNPGNEDFKISINSNIYVDKTELIEYTNSVLNTKQRYICVSRPRRFGKTYVAEMLCAYYDCSVDSNDLFKKYKISKSKSYKEYLNKYNVISLNIQQFLSSVDNIDDLTNYIQKKILNELRKYYSNVISDETTILADALEEIYVEDNKKYIFIVDEWDCIFREAKNNKELQNKYLDFLRDLFKDKKYVALVYMTGILPIKKTGTHSGLNMFKELSMTRTYRLSKYTGFTEEEVKSLCNKYDVDFDEMSRWYNGYIVGDYKIYNPKSVVESILDKKFD